MATMAAALNWARTHAADRPAIIDRERTFTWAEHLDRVARAARLLRESGVDEAQRFAVLSRNSFRHAELIHAGYWSGAVPVPVNCRLAPPEIAHILADADCRLVFVEPVFRDLLDTPELKAWKDRAITIGDGDRATEGLIAAAEPLALRPAREDEDAILVYTGGTTGRPKGVRLSHRNVVSNGLQVGMVLGARADDVYFHVAPMFHSADLLGTAFTLRGAAHAYLAAFTPQDYLAAMQDFGVTATMAAPTMLILTLQACDTADYDLGALRWLFYGSAPMAPEWVEKAMAAFATAELAQGYGLSETSPILTILEAKDHRRALAEGRTDRLASAGRPLPGVELRLVDQDDGVGEVAVRGPNVTPGYLNLPEVNAAAFRDGWFLTGDVGRLEEDGFLYLLDRRKDMIVTGGENVYSTEVEAALYRHPGVAEAAVFGVSHEVYGETVCAAVVPAPGATLTEDELAAHCRAHIGGYKVPRRILFVDALPKSAVGKVLKTELRNRYA